MRTTLIVCLFGIAGLAVAIARDQSISPKVVSPRGPSAPLPKPFATLIVGNEVRTPPRSPMPALHQPFRDPVFDTCITRIADASQWPEQKRIRHYYSKSNPFNVDNTRAILWGDQGAFLLYDTKTWKPIDNLKLVSGDAEISWHPSDPNLFYVMDMDASGAMREMYRYDIRGGSKKLLRRFSEYLSARGKMEGNMDAKGRYYAMVGQRSKAENDLEAFVYDVEKDQVVARRPVTLRMVDDWISVTPSGRYVVMMGKDRSRVFDINLNPVLELPQGSFGHADLCQSADGRDLMVVDGADHQLDNNRNINIADLATGKVTIGIRIGWGTTPHVSCRNLNLPGWALISTQGPDRKYSNRDYEIFWLKLDGTGEVRRVAHHHSDRELGGYFAEQHAVSNRDGTMILFASNWGGTIVNEFLVDLRDSGQTAGKCRAPSP